MRGFFSHVIVRALRSRPRADQGLSKAAAAGRLKKQAQTDATTAAGLLSVKSNRLATGIERRFPSIGLPATMLQCQMEC